MDIRASLESLLCSAFWSHLQGDKGLELSPISVLPHRGDGEHLANLSLAFRQRVDNRKLFLIYISSQ